MPIAFKEWAVTVRALAEGEQLLTLRKGGIREANKHFELEHDRFFLYPTFDHQRNDLVRESHQPELRRALEEGVWADGEPPAEALDRATAASRSPTASASAPGPRSPAHWTDHRPARASTRCRRTTCGRPTTPRSAWRGSAATRCTCVLLRTYRIPRPVTVKVKDEFGGCRSWLEITRDLPFEGTPVLSDDEFERAAEEIAAIVERREPASPTLARPMSSSIRRRARRRCSSSASAAAATSSARWPCAELAPRARHAARRRRPDLGAAARSTRCPARAASTRSTGAEPLNDGRRARRARHDRARAASASPSRRVAGSLGEPTRARRPAPRPAGVGAGARRRRAAARLRPRRPARRRRRRPRPRRRGRASAARWPTPSCSPPRRPRRSACR